jgi:hypothetical protein
MCNYSLLYYASHLLPWVGEGRPCALRSCGFNRCWSFRQSISCLTPPSLGRRRPTLCSSKLRFQPLLVIQAVHLLPAPFSKGLPSPKYISPHPGSFHLPTSHLYERSAHASSFSSACYLQYPFSSCSIKFLVKK